MTLSDCEEYSISRLLTMNDAKYCMGLSQQEGLLVKGQWVIWISKNENGVYERFDYNLKTKELKMSKKEETDSEYIYVSKPIIGSNCMIDESNDGKRWEGCCLNGSPLGYGSLYNSSNELIYQGVMIGDKKECFGIEFYPDLGQIEYIGCYYNNERHGYGMLYDRKGNVLYEGDFICGSSYIEKNVILKDIDDDNDSEEEDEMSNHDNSHAEKRKRMILNDFEDTSVHSFIRELVIDEGYGGKFNGDLMICGFDYLERLVIKKGVFRNANSLKISDNPVLNSIETESGLTVIRTPSGVAPIYRGAFLNVKSVTITSTSKDRLIDLIFLNSLHSI